MRNWLGLHKRELPTPCLVIDKEKLHANLALMNHLAKLKNVAVRPHVKTHKCSQLAQLQLDYGAVGICVTKVSEALVMARAGITGILITSPVIARNKIPSLIGVLELAPDTMIVIDNPENAIQLNSCMAEGNLMVNVLIDIDGGIGRTGVTDFDAIKLALVIKSLPYLKLKGIQCYAGHLQHIADISERRSQSHAILVKAAGVRHKLLELGFDCHIQTGSGTGTFSIDAELDCVTEIQPGSYCVMDQEYSNIEYKEQKFLSAMTMLTTVISNNHISHVTVDAGTKALYRVVTKPEIISHSELIYDWDGFGDEHGKITALN